MDRASFGLIVGGIHDFSFSKIKDAENPSEKEKRAAKDSEYARLAKAAEDDIDKINTYVARLSQRAEEQKLASRRPE